MNAWNFFLLLLSPLCFSLTNIALRRYQTKMPHHDRFILCFQGSYCLASSLLYACGVRALPSLFTLGLGIVFGASFFLCTLCGARCYVVGPMSLTTVLINSSMLIPILWSVLFWQDSFTKPMGLGVALILLTFLLSSLGSGESKGKINRKWLLLVLVAFLCNGMSAVVQKARQRLEPEGDLFVFLAIGYGMAALLFFLNYFRQKERRPSSSKAPLQKPLWWGLVLMAGVGSFLGNFLLQILCTRVPSGILYPVINGGLCVLTASASFVLFREKPAPLKLCSIAVGVLGIVITSF